MPWRELKPMDLKVMFIAEYLSEKHSFSQLCQDYQISRKTGYKWVERYEAEGPCGLDERSRRRHHQTYVVPLAVRQAIIELRSIGETVPGPKKIQNDLKRRFPGEDPPSKTTIYNILKAADLITPRLLRQRVAVYPKPLRKAELPNQLFSADYKGQFLTGAGVWCYPLTIMDHASRFLLACESMASTNLKETQQTFERVFREHGMPERIRTDNGVPFASKGRAGLSQLSIWWLRLGIIPERIEPGRPDQNGRHERMHRTLKVPCLNRRQLPGTLSKNTLIVSCSTIIMSGDTRHLVRKPRRLAIHPRPELTRRSCRKWGMQAMLSVTWLTVVELSVAQVCGFMWGIYSDTRPLAWR